MVKDNHVDENILDLMIESGIVTGYARKVLTDRQLDAFEWKGKIYSP
jgi:hypothetical protein